MADSIDEVAEIVSQSQALVINMGTINEGQRSVMLEAVKAANQDQVPIVFDPVGAGATRLRMDTATLLINKGQFSVIRGNYSEIATLCGYRSGKGVDAVGSISEEWYAAMQELAKQTGSVVAASGAIDYVTDGTRQAWIHNGTPQLARVTGTGCMATSVIGCCLGAGIPAFAAAVTGLVAVGLAGEKATSSGNEMGLGHFRTHFFDTISQLSKEELEKGAKVRITDVE
jgi:hydroxyethylthiazole kinase